MLRLALYSRQTVPWKRSSSSGGQKCNNQRTGKRWQAGKNFVMGGRLFSGIRTVFRKLCGHKSHTTAGKYVSTHGHQCNRYGQKSNRGGQVAPLPQSHDRYASAVLFRRALSPSAHDAGLYSSDRLCRVLRRLRVAQESETLTKVACVTFRRASGYNTNIT